ncbi:glycine betaine ABC transporter substrate-binding protein [Salisediminibacterium halotolerans]|uniref:Glycine betaine/proline transport system substrate-binding protein n=1 Tax=Salisediminibacterium halotolerans TaxID=517425 RepID=A0A1H9WYN4_9BACI|nr:glycine betaine ABC transporter substrate-binding protein [Salisediminibacterium haloalkalitolerans]SES38901.1 glycine betaine/proline transport system substrate-binding protein [Salisediminibacterium haloalkalitolerans]
MKKTLFYTLSLSALVLTACGNADGENNDNDNNNNLNDNNNEDTAGYDPEGEEIELTYVAWESELASTNVIGQVLEEAGYDVELTVVEQSPMWSSVANQEADGFVGGWLPSDMQAEYDEYGDDIVDLGPNLEGNRTGLAVPDYMDIESIDELSSDVVDEIIGIDAGAGIMMSTEEVVDVYDLDIDVTPSSDSAMTAALDSAINSEEPVVVTAWQPHWKFNAYDIRFLEDPEEVYAAEEEIRTIVREGLEEDHPVAYQILDNFYWDQEDMNEIMLAVAEDEEEIEDAAADWIEENRDMVDEWLDVEE